MADFSKHPYVRMHLDGDSCWPDLIEKAQKGELIHTTALEVALLRGGMASGKSSVSFRFDLEDGRTIVAETSLIMLENILNAFRAAL